MRSLHASLPTAGAGVLSQMILERNAAENPAKEKKPQPSKVEGFNKINGLPDRRTGQTNNNINDVVFQQENGVSSSVLASEIFNLINRKPRIVKLQFCPGCDRHKVPKKFSAIPSICCDCIKSAKTMPPRAAARFIEGAKENLHRKLNSIIGGLR